MITKISYSRTIIYIYIIWIMISGYIIYTERDCEHAPPRVAFNNVSRTDYSSSPHPRFACIRFVFNPAVNISIHIHTHDAHTYTLYDFSTKIKRYIGFTIDIYFFYYYYYYYHQPSSFYRAHTA